MSRLVADIAPSTHKPVSAFLAATVALLKPITWFAPVWAFACGTVSSRGEATGGNLLHDVPIVLAGLVLAGPMLCGASQAVNDWFDRHVDAINEPGRPIPSGRLPGHSALVIAVLWTASSLFLAAALGETVLVAAFLGMMLAWAYSAPPARLKRDGWLGAAAAAISYEGLAWFTGAAVVAGGTPRAEVIWLASLYSLGAIGIMTLNDFKSIEGDKRFGIRSLPARYGPERASRIACILMIGSQIAVCACLVEWGFFLAAALITALIVVQVALMPRFLRDPKAEAPRYNATGTGLYVLGMMVAAVAVGTLGSGVS